jgi:hypothetical protein
MNVFEFLLMLVVAAAALALWVDVRLGERSPRSPTHVVLHAATAWAAVGVVVPLVVMLVDPTSQIRTLTGLLGLLLPSWTYAYLAMLWALKLVVNALPR